MTKAMKEHGWQELILIFVKHTPFQKDASTVDYETLALHYHKPEETGIMDTLMTLNAKDKEVLILII